MQKRSPIFFALILIGAILVIVGIVYGLGSRQVTYKHIGQGSIAHYLTQDTTAYLQMEGSSALYIVHVDNFKPTLPSFADSDTISFVYDPSETTSIDVQSVLGTHLQGSAAKVVSITGIDANGVKTYSTPEYTSNSQGFSNNQWPLGLVILVVGLLAIGGAFFLPRRKVAPVTPTAPSYMANGFPPQVPNSQPYGQPQQGFSAPYPPYPPAFQPQSGTYAPSPNLYPDQQPYPGNTPSQQPSTAYGLPPNMQDPYNQANQYNQYSQPDQSVNNRVDHMQVQNSAIAPQPQTNSDEHTVRADTPSEQSQIDNDKTIRATPTNDSDEKTVRANPPYGQQGNQFMRPDSTLPPQQ